MIVTAYFFTDEAADLYGPYPTAELAAEASAIYNRALNGPVSTADQQRNLEINRLSRDLGESLKQFYTMLSDET